MGAHSSTQIPSVVIDFPCAAEFFNLWGGVTPPRPPLFACLPDSLPENLASADCFEERNESEVPVFDLSRASRAENDGSSPHYRHAENQKN